MSNHQHETHHHEGHHHEMALQLTPQTVPAQPVAVHAGHATHLPQHGTHTGHGKEHDAHAAHAAHAGHAAKHGSEHAGHVDHSGHEQLFRNRSWICLILTIPLLLYTNMIQEWGRFTMPVFPGSDWIAPFFAVIVFAIGGVPFLQMMIPELRRRQPGMMTLISLAITTSFAYSLYAALTGSMGGFFWEMVTLIDIMLLGHWLEMRSVRPASGALNELAKLLPDTAERVKADGSVEVVPASQLQSGDMVLIRPGARIPADGEVVEGSSDLNEAMITGESQPVKKWLGSSVIAGTLNGAGSLRVRVTATGRQDSPGRDHAFG